MTLKNIFNLCIICVFLFNCANPENKTSPYNQKVEDDLQKVSIIQEKFGCTLGIDTGIIQKIHIYKCHIDSFPKEFYQLMYLESIVIEKSTLKKLPNLAKFNNLNSFKLLNSQLKEKKVNIKSISNKLSFFSIIGCDLEEINFSQRNNITVLNLRSNNLKEFKIKELHNLEYLSISYNNLRLLEINDLPNLEQVDCDNNPNLDSTQVKKSHNNTNIYFYF